MGKPLFCDCIGPIGADNCRSPLDTLEVDLGDVDRYSSPSNASSYVWHFGMHRCSPSPEEAYSLVRGCLSDCDLQTSPSSCHLSPQVWPNPPVRCPGELHKKFQKKQTTFSTSMRTAGLTVAVPERRKCGHSIPHPAVWTRVPWPLLIGIWR